MEYLIGFLLGVMVGFLANNSALILKVNTQRMQLAFSLMQLKMYKKQKKRAKIGTFHKVLFGLAYRFNAKLLDYVTFKPHTLVRWHRDMVKIIWKDISKRKNKAGRPHISDFLRESILLIAKENPTYKHKKIAFIINEQLDIKICASTVKSILKKYHNPKPIKPDQTFKTFLHNHKDCIVSMDFKMVYDWKVKEMFILNIIDHSTRAVIFSRATYNPNYPWILQQLNEAFAFSDGSKKYMIMDNDPVFRSLKLSLKHIYNLEPIYTSLQSPWQNGIVERYNKTQKEELLDFIIPINIKHLNRLLYEYTLYYNHARVHTFNKGKAPQANNHNNRSGKFVSVNNISVESIAWSGGLHHSYRLAA